MEYAVVFTGRPIRPMELGSTSIRELGILPGNSGLLRLSLCSRVATNSEPSLSPPEPPPHDVTQQSSSPSLEKQQLANQPCEVAVTCPVSSTGCDTAPTEHVETSQAHSVAPRADIELELVDGAAQQSMLQEAMQQLHIGCEGAAFAQALRLLQRYVSNILESPRDPKFRKIRQRNVKFQETVGRHAAARQLLRLLGFLEKQAEVSGDLAVEPVWSLPDDADLSPLGVFAQLAQSELTAITTTQTMIDPPITVATSPVSVTDEKPRVQASVPTQQTTLTQAQVETLRKQKLLPRSDVSVSRELAVLRPGQSAPPSELADDFFELTEHDLPAMALSAGPQSNTEQLQTAAMRELSRLQSIKSYTHALVRVRLPNGLIVQASFHPQEPVAHVEQLVASCLHETYRQPFTLLTSPPRVTLDSKQSLVQAGLVPAATAFLAWKSPLDLSEVSAQDFLSSEALSSLSELDDANNRLAFPTEGSAPAKRSLNTSPIASQSKDTMPTGNKGTGSSTEKPKQPKWLRR